MFDMRKAPGHAEAHGLSKSTAFSQCAGFDLSTATELAPARVRDETAPEGAVAISTPNHELVIDFGDSADLWLGHWVNGVPAAAVHPSLKKYVDAERRREVERNARLPGTPAAAGRSSEVEVLTEVDPADTRGTGYHVD